MQVEDASFLIVQQQAAKHGRMDLARVMMAAMDDTRKIQVGLVRHRGHVVMRPGHVRGRVSRLLAPASVR